LCAILAAVLWLNDAAEAQTPILYLTPQNELVMIPGYGTLGTSATALASDDQGKTWHTWDAFSTWPAMAYADVVRRGTELLAFGFNSNDGYAGGTYLWQSSNDGLTWTGGNVLTTPDSWAPMNQRVLLTTSGRLIVPVEQIVSGSEGSGANNVGTIYSDNGGQSWTRSPIFGPPAGYPTAPEGIGEPAVVELANGKDWMVCRGLGGHLLQSFSDDGGATWDPPSATTLVSPLSDANAKRIPGTNDVICIWDNAQPGTSTDFGAGGAGSSLWGPRYPLVYAISKDNCQTWSQPVVIDSDWAA
jgi:Neuraminidase (sialidase)